MNADDLIVGIDLGTTYSLIAVVDAAGPRVLTDEDGEARLPSVVSFVQNGRGFEPLVGWPARRPAGEHPAETVHSVKRLIGRSLADVQSERGFLSYALAPGPRDSVRVRVLGHDYAPEEISAFILRELRQRAERQLGTPVHRAVITVPAYFDDAQRQATRDAAAGAALEVVRIINEPTAAALAYGIGLREKRAAAPAPHAAIAAAPGRVSLPLPGCHETSAATSMTVAPRRAEIVAVFDLGGGTLDVSILRLVEGVFQVLSTAGDTHLGGDDFDRALVEHVAPDFVRRFGDDALTPVVRQRLRIAAEECKLALSSAERAILRIDLSDGGTFERPVTRGEFESAVAPLVERTLTLTRQALRDAKLLAAEVGEIVLVGGSTRMPIIRRRVGELFEKTPYTALDPDQVVAIGAAMQAAILSGSGARSGLSAAALDTLLLDVLPLSLGIETMGGAMGKLILRNSPIPCRAVEQFTTFVDGQTAIKFSVLQGERELAADCRKLSEFELRGLPPMPAGMPKIEVEFLVDANGILSVTARELRSGTQAGIQVIPNRGLTRDEVERMTRESIAHGQRDIDAHRRIDLRNQVTFDTQKAEQMLARFGARLAPGERARIEGEIAALRAQAGAGGDLDALQAALQEFGRGTLRLAEIGIAEALRS